MEASWRQRILEDAGEEGIITPTYLLEFVSERDAALFKTFWI